MDDSADVKIATASAPEGGRDHLVVLSQLDDLKSHSLTLKQSAWQDVRAITGFGI